MESKYTLISSRYPLHLAVWEDKPKVLNKLLKRDTVNIECLDPRGLTPLQMAVYLNHQECVQILLNNDADVLDSLNKDGWSIIHEATSVANPEMLQILLQYRYYQRYIKEMKSIPQILKAINEAPDFYFEIKWEFSSLIPLVSKLCPSDTCKIWKSGPNVRIDSTLLDFSQHGINRGCRSYLFHGTGAEAKFIELDHDNKTVSTEVYEMGLPFETIELELMKPHPNHVKQRLQNPIVTTYLDVDKIRFERSKSGIFGWKSEKSEMVNGYECKVYNAQNVELITKSRFEHLTTQTSTNTVLNSSHKKTSSKVANNSTTNGGQLNGIKIDAANLKIHTTPPPPTQTSSVLLTNPVSGYPLVGSNSIVNTLLGFKTVSDSTGTINVDHHLLQSNSSNDSSKTDSLKKICSKKLSSSSTSFSDINNSESKEKSSSSSASETTFKIKGPQNRLFKKKQISLGAEAKEYEDEEDMCLLDSPILEETLPSAVADSSTIIITQDPADPPVTKKSTKMTTAAAKQKVASVKMVPPSLLPSRHKKRNGYTALKTTSSSSSAASSITKLSKNNTRNSLTTSLNISDTEKLPPMSPEIYQTNRLIRQLTQEETDTEFLTDNCGIHHHRSSVNFDETMLLPSPDASILNGGNSILKCNSHHGDHHNHLYTSLPHSEDLATNGEGPDEEISGVQTGPENEDIFLDCVGERDSFLLNNHINSHDLIHFDEEAASSGESSISVTDDNPYNPFGLTLFQYFDHDVYNNTTKSIPDNFNAATSNTNCATKHGADHDETKIKGGSTRVIGRTPKEIVSKSQKFRATLWISEECPLSLKDQILPIIDLMPKSNAHFAKLKEFITLQLPPGFPVKIEIPIFHVLNARITFGNICGKEDEVYGVYKLLPSSSPENQKTDFKNTSCIIDSSVFDIPLSYTNIDGGCYNNNTFKTNNSCADFMGARSSSSISMMNGAGGNSFKDGDSEESEAMLLKYAIQQSLMDEGTENDKVTIWEALRKEPATAPALQIPAASNRAEINNDIPGLTEEEEQLKFVIEMSRKEIDDFKVQEKQFDAELEKIIQLSILEQ